MGVCEWTHILPRYLHILAKEYYKAGAKGPCLFLDGQLSVHLLLGLQDVPLSDGSPGVGQHVGPVAQLRPRAVEAHKDLADGIVLADLVIVQNSYNNLHFLQKGKTETKKSVVHSKLVPLLRSAWFVLRSFTSVLPFDRIWKHEPTGSTQRNNGG